MTATDTDTTDVAVPPANASVFAGDDEIFTKYTVRIKLRDKIMGGVPRNPKIMEAWIRTNTGLSDRSEELRQVTVRTMRDMGTEIDPNASWDEIVKISEQVGAAQQTNGFKSNYQPNRDAENFNPDGGLFIETRQLKAAIREGTNVNFAGQRWGATKKGPKSFVAERVFPYGPDQIYLHRAEWNGSEWHLGERLTQPDGVDLFIGHITDKQGSRSTLTYYEYAGLNNDVQDGEGNVLARPGEQIMAEFQLMVLDDSVKAADWKRLWVYLQEAGIGALRSQGFGRFDVVYWGMTDD